MHVLRDKIRQIEFLLCFFLNAQRTLIDKLCLLQHIQRSYMINDEKKFSHVSNKKFESINISFKIENVRYSKIVSLKFDKIFMN